MKKYSSFQSLVYSTDPDAIPSDESTMVPTPPPEEQTLIVCLDKKHRRGKIVTLVTGFQGQDKDLTDLGKQLKNKCGSGGSAKDGQIIIQGDFQQKVTSLLSQWGYKVQPK